MQIQAISNELEKNTRFIQILNNKVDGVEGNKEENQGEGEDKILNQIQMNETLLQQLKSITQ